MPLLSPLLICGQLLRLDFVGHDYMNRVSKSMVEQLPSFVCVVGGQCQGPFHYFIRFASGVLVQKVESVSVRGHNVGDDRVEDSYKGWKGISGENRRLFYRKVNGLLLIDDQQA